MSRALDIANKLVWIQHKDADEAIVELRRLAALEAALLALEPVCSAHDDGYWTEMNTTAGRAFAQRLRFAGSPRITLYATAACEPLLAKIAELEAQVKALSGDAARWPVTKDVGRYGDMSPSAHMRVGLDSDNDVFVSVWDENGGGCVEFCNPGGGGGGSSTKTRMALIALMCAMEEDNAARPDKDWWAARALAAPQP